MRVDDDVTFRRRHVDHTAAKRFLRFGELHPQGDTRAQKLRESRNGPDVLHDDNRGQKRSRELGQNVDQWFEPARRDRNP